MLVKKGDPLIDLYPTQGLAFQQEARSGVQSAVASMQTLKETIAVAKKEVEKLEVSVQQAKIKLEEPNARKKYCVS